LNEVWEYLGISEEEFRQRVLYGSCIKCGSTARTKDSCLCLAHMRGYHKWRNTRERDRIARKEFLEKIEQNRFAREKFLRERQDW
jgi:hypothetical protein